VALVNGDNAAATVVGTDALGVLSSMSGADVDAALEARAHDRAAPEDVNRRRKRASLARCRRQAERCAAGTLALPLDSLTIIGYAFACCARSGLRPSGWLS
jgi:hypothetical protein